jgi:hypothetical protein
MVNMLAMYARIAPLQSLLDKYETARETLEMCRPGAAIEPFGPFDRLETMSPSKLDEAVENGRPIVERVKAAAAAAKSEKDREDQAAMTETDRRWAGPRRGPRRGGPTHRKIGGYYIGGWCLGGTRPASREASNAHAAERVHRPSTPQ